MKNLYCCDWKLVSDFQLALIFRSFLERFYSIILSSNIVCNVGKSSCIKKLLYRIVKSTSFHQSRCQEPVKQKLAKYMQNILPEKLSNVLSLFRALNEKKL